MQRALDVEMLSPPQIKGDQDAKAEEGEKPDSEDPLLESS